MELPDRNFRIGRHGLILKTEASYSCFVAKNFAVDRGLDSYDVHESIVLKAVQMMNLERGLRTRVTRRLDSVRPTRITPLEDRSEIRWMS